MSGQHKKKEVTIMNTIKLQAYPLPYPNSTPKPNITSDPASNPKPTPISNPTPNPNVNPSQNPSARKNCSAKKQKINIPFSS